MRTIIEVPDEDINRLDEISREEGQSRAAVVREAIAQYLAKKKKPLPQEAFGIWKGRNIDSVEYVRQLRSEWDHRP